MRTTTIKRKTNETDITLKLNIDGGSIKANTGIGFFDHMLNSFATHGGFGLEVNVKGDLNVDCHHTVEDTGIALGQAFNEILKDKSGIKRFASFYIPMDEALAFAAIDISGRPFFVFNGEFPQERCGSYDSCMTEEFLRALAYNTNATLHVNILYGNNSHHMIEAAYKAVAHALNVATEKSGTNVPLSTKGVL